MGTSLRACIVVVFLLLPPPGVCAQSGAGSARMTGRVSGAVAVSVPGAGALSDEARVSVSQIDAATTVVSISGSGGREARVRLPVQLRSNVGYYLRASLLSPDALTVRLAVDEVRATGKFVHAGALEAASRREAPAAPLLTVANQPSPVAILSGPPVSKAGTFTSPDNALEVVLSVEIGPRADAGAWSAQLTISAAPGR